MTVNTDPLVDEKPGGTPPPKRRRPLLLGLIGLLAVLAIAAAAFAVLRDDGSGGGGGRGGGGREGQSAPTVTFGPEGDATTLPEPPLGGNPVLGLDVEAGPAGTEVRLQGTAFRQGEEFGPVDLFWDQIGGQKLLTVDPPRFSVKLKIPADAPVLNEGHNIIAVQRKKTGEVATQTFVKFYVLPPRP